MAIKNIIRIQSKISPVKVILVISLLYTFIRGYNSVTVTKASDCVGNDRHYSNGYCYFIPSQAQAGTRDEAESYCRDSGGYLSGIHSSDDQAAVEALLTKGLVTTDIWVDAMFEDPESLVTIPESLWRWTAKCPAWETCGRERTCGFTASSTNFYKKPLDIAFVLDGSGSINKTDWKIVQEFMVRFVEKLNIGTGNNASQVAIIKFGNKANVEAYLNQYTTKQSLLDKINSLTHQPENTNTADGIGVTNDEIFQADNGDRLGVPNIQILATDGKSTFDSDLTIPEAERSKDESVKSFIIGVTDNVELAEITGISDSPQTKGETFWLVPDFQTLNDDEIYVKALNKICELNVRNDIMNQFAVDKQGCFGDRAASSDLPYKILTNDNSPNFCPEYCRSMGRDYAGLQNGTYCYCGNEFGKYGSKMDCNINCYGDNTKTCGGLTSNEIYYVPTPYKAIWTKGQPVIQDSNTLCGAMDRQNNYRYAVVSCIQEYKFSCKLPIGSCSNAPSDGSYQTMGVPDNFCLYTGASPDTWYRARQVCINKGGDLLTILDTEEGQLQPRVATALEELSWANDDRYVLIGLYKQGFITTQDTGSMGTLLSYSNFAPIELKGTTFKGQPDVTAGTCVYMSSYNSFRWYTGSCGGKKSFICQWPTSGAAPQTTTTTRPGATTTTSGGTPNPATPSSGQSTGGEDEGLSLTYIILIVVLVVLALIIIIVVIYFCVKKSKGTVHPTKGKYEKYSNESISPTSSTMDLKY